MSDDIDIPEKPRKHRWVTEALSQGDKILSVWPSPDELTNEKKRARFLETIVKVGNDPRVEEIKKVPHELHSVVYLFYLNA